MGGRDRSLRLPFLVNTTAGLEKMAPGDKKSRGNEVPPGLSS